MATSPSLAKQFFCTNCGKIISEQAVICKSCGVKPTGHRNFCRQCGTAISLGQVSCSICGAKVAQVKLRGCRSCFMSCVALFVALLLVIVGGATALAVFGTRPLVSSLKERLNDEVFSQVPMEVANISVKWTTNKTGYFAADEFSVTDKATAIFHKFVDYDSAIGEFAVQAKTTENLYKLVDSVTGLKKLGITKLYEREYNDAYARFQSLPVPYKNDLRSLVPQSLSEARFYDPLVPKGDEVTLTGSVELTKHASGKWLVERFPSYNFSCGEDFTPESKLREEDYKLDDPQTKEVIASVIKKREKFAASVGPVWDKYQKDEAARATEEARVRAEQDRLAREAREEAKRIADEAATAEQERQRQAAIQDQQAVIQDQIDNFGEFCKPGTNYNGNFQFRGPNNVVTVDVAVAFDKYVYKDKNKVDGRLTIFLPGGKSKSERTFSVAVNAADVAEYPVTGTIDNSKLFTLAAFKKITIVNSQSEADNATAFYGLLRNNDRIDIQFTDTMRFTITTSDGQDEHLLNLTEENGRRIPVKRTVVTQTGSQTPTRSQVSSIPADAVSLDEELRKSECRYLSHFVEYGSKLLYDRLDEEQRSYNRVDAFDKPTAQKGVDAVRDEIRAAQAAIAKITFWGEYDISTSNVKVLGDRSSCTISINTGFRIPQSRGELVSFPVPSVSCDTVGCNTITGRINFSVNGSTESIQELVRKDHHYKARIQFKNLRHQSHYVAADLQKIDIIKVVDEPQGMMGGTPSSFRAPSRE